jgi:hypothetical protein
LALPNTATLSPAQRPGQADRQLHHHRVQMDIADFFHTLVPTPGTPVYIRG